MNFTIFALFVTIGVASALPQWNNFGGGSGQQPSWNGNQQWPNWNNNQNPTPTPAQTTSTTTATVATAQSPAYLRCTREECLATNEYNPVCGSDNNNYVNLRKLDCANQCGQRYIPNWQEVTMLRRGACTSGGRVA